MKVDYVAGEVQLRHLRLNSMKVRQNVTYHCKNSEAMHMKLMSADGIEMHLNSHKKNQPKILSDGCRVRSFLYT